MYEYIILGIGLVLLFCGWFNENVIPNMVGTERNRESAKKGAKTYYNLGGVLVVIFLVIAFKNLVGL